MKKTLLAVGILALTGFGGYFALTAPALWSLLHPTRDVADAEPADLARGHALFFAGSCGTCHATPGQGDETRLGGGLALTSGFGTFYMPNISPDVQDGIGAWTTAEFTRPMLEAPVPFALAASRDPTQRTLIFATRVRIKSDEERSLWRGQSSGADHDA